MPYKNKEDERAYQRAYRIKHAKKKTENNRRYTRAHPEKVKQFHLKSKYNLTPDQLVEMEVSQDGACAICKEKPHRLFVDHDHKTDRIRGLLCHTCNSMLGFAKDLPDRLRHAADYLEKTNAP